MQVERSAQAGSGGRVSTTWVIYREVRNTGEKSPTRPHSFRQRKKALFRGGATRGACARLARWWGKSSPGPRSVAGLRGRSATLGLRTAQTPTGGSSEEFSSMGATLNEQRRVVGSTDEGRGRRENLRTSEGHGIPGGVVKCVDIRRNTNSEGSVLGSV